MAFVLIRRRLAVTINNASLVIRPHVLCQNTYNGMDTNGKKFTLTKSKIYLSFPFLLTTKVWKYLFLLLYLGVGTNYKGLPNNIYLLPRFECFFLQLNLSFR